MQRPKRRIVKTYLVEPFKQLKFGLHVVAVCLAFVIILSGLFVRAFYEQYEQVAQLFQVADSSDVLDNNVFWRNGILIGVTLVAFVGTMMWVVIRKTQRMYGPIISILRFVNELKKGNYAVRINVRQRDDFQNLVISLNELAVDLHKQHGNPLKDNSQSGLDGVVERMQDYEDGVCMVTDPSDSQNIEKAG
jgi:signal transduction histidine kinase